MGLFSFPFQGFLLITLTLAHPPLLWQLDFPPHFPPWDETPLFSRCSRCPILRLHWAPTGAFPQGIHAVPLSLCGNYSAMARDSGCHGHNAEESPEEAEFSNEMLISQSKSRGRLHLQTKTASWCLWPAWVPRNQVQDHLATMRSMKGYTRSKTVGGI